MRCVCLKEYKPTLVRLKRQAKNNYITGTITLHALDTRAGDDDGYIGNPYPATSEEGGGGGGEPLSINTTQVYDPYFGKTQQELNKQFAQGGGGGGSGVTFEVVGNTLYIETEEPSGDVSIFVENDTLYIQTT
jgi:hypothetical protein